MKISVTKKRAPGIRRYLANRWWMPVLVMVCLLTASMPVLAQEKTIRGRVTNSAGAPISGASVQIKGTTTGTTTNNNGEYLISAPKGAVLVISNIGFADQEITVADQVQINAQLTTAAKDIAEVVVVGYGTQRKRDVTGSVASVNLEAFHDAPNTNIGQYLQGSVPGLNVGLSTFAGGTPPISIRGRVSLNGNQTVLIILDGVQYSGTLSSINPEDIASIDVLKDASSTAVYGAQAANGVILITSRKGRYNQKAKIAFAGAFTSQKPTVGDLTPKDREGYLNGVKEAYYEKSYLGPDFTQPDPSFNIANYVESIMRDGSGNLLPNNYNWWDEGTSTGSIQQYNLSINGGGDRVTYFLSGSYVNQKGFIINDLFKRKAIRANIETRPLNWWKVGLLSSASFVNQDGAEPSLGSIIQHSPLLVPYDADGKLIAFPTNTLEPNPFVTYYVDDYNRNNYIFGNIYSDIDFPFLKGLNYRMNFGNNYRTTQHYFASIYDASQTGRAYKENTDSYDYTFDNILTYTKGFGKHNITATLLYGAIERRFDSTFAEARGFPRLTLSYHDLSLGAIQSSYSTSYNEALEYQMARVNYRFDNKYLVTATIRRDGFSGFSKNNKYAYFPVLALGWVMAEENFMKNLKAVDYLKLRVGYGESGNQTSRYSSISRVSTSPAYVFGDGGTTAFGQQVATLGNEDLKWERTRGLNVGVDFSMFNNSLSGTLDFYNNNTHDLLYTVAIPSTYGFTSFITNLGEIRNTGFEASISQKIFDQRDFKWTASLNFSTNRNRIMTLTGADANKDGKEDDLIASSLFIGKSINAIYDYQPDGIYQLNDTRITGFPVGTVRIVDQNKDNDIKPEHDRVFLGRQEPAYRMSLLNTFSYKGFSLTIFVNSIQGGKDGYLGNNNPNFFREDNTIRRNELRGIDYWSPSNPNGKYPRNISGSRAKVEPGNWQDRSFVRLQDISLSYNFTSNLLKKTKAQTINLYVSGKNLKTWTDWEGWDPETGEGLVNSGRPVLRGFTVGLNITY